MRAPHSKPLLRPKPDAPQVTASAYMSHDIGIIQTSRFVASSNRFVGFTTSQLNGRVVQLP